MAHYYEFPAGGGSWVKETVDQTPDGAFLTRRQYTGDPRVDSSAKLDNITEFNAPTEPAATQFRQGFVMAGGQIEYQPWEPV